MPPLDLDALAQIVDKMTPGPWSWESIAEKSNEFAIGTAFNAHGEQLSGQLPPEEHLEDSVIERRYLVGTNESGHANFSDARGIVALVNAADQLIAAAMVLKMEALAATDALNYSRGRSVGAREMKVRLRALLAETETPRG